MSFTSRKNRPGVTDHRGRASMLGGRPMLWVVTPYLDNGAGENKNEYGNIHNQHSSITAGAGSNAFSEIGENYTLARMLTAGGVPCYQKVTVNGKKRYRGRLEYEDGAPHNQPGPYKKVMPRVGTNGTAKSDGLGVLVPAGQVAMYHFTFNIPEADRTVYEAMDDLVVFQTKNSNGQPAISVTLNSFNYRNGFTTPPGAGAGLNLQIRAFQAANRNAVRVRDSLPTDTPIHGLLRVVLGIGQWTTGQWYASGSYVKNGANVYVCASAEGQAGATPPTHGTGTVSDGTLNWTWYSALPAYGAVTPSIQMWTALDGAAPVLGANVSGLTTLDPTSASDTNVQWMFYMGAGTSYQEGVNQGTPGTPQAWFTPGKSYQSDWGDVGAFPLDIAAVSPTSAQVAHWFSLMARR